MNLTVTYKNERGAVEMQGGGRSSPLRITAIEGLGLVTKEYVTATYAGYDGQETISSRALARSITIAMEICTQNVFEEAHHMLEVFTLPGMLYIESENLNRRIKCDQVQCPDMVRVLKGQIATLVVQFVCDNPYFEDGEDTIVPLYQRTKLLTTPFSLPTAFGNIVLGGVLQNKGILSIEPIISLYYPSAVDEAEGITIKNENTGAKIQLLYAPADNDIVIIDVKNRKITSSVNGNIISNLSDDTFLGDFVLKRGNNTLSVDMGDVSSGFTIECRYNNLYCEAVIV